MRKFLIVLACLSLLSGCQYHQPKTEEIRSIVAEKAAEVAMQPEQENSQSVKIGSNSLVPVTEELHNVEIEKPTPITNCIDIYAERISGECVCVEGFIQKNNKCIKEAYIAVTSPKDGEIYNKLPDVIEINGEISDNCKTVEVSFYNYGILKDQWSLAKYKYGDKTFHYYIKKSLGNIDSGENKYLITADCDGGQKKTASITQGYFPAVTNEALDQELGFSDEDAFIKEESSVTTKTVQANPIVIPKKACDPNYSGCVPIASDVDCAGGSGNGPLYTPGPVRVIGSDIYDLDRDNDGYGCE